MTHIRSIFSEEDEKKALQDGLIAVRKHPEKELFIYCYTKRAPYTEGAWTNPAVLHSRGLIVNDQGHVVARPWKKFFNYGTADAPYFNPSARALRVLDKADGCFPGNALLNLWGGGTVRIGDVVKNKLDVTLVGMDDEGKIVPTKITNWFDNGLKTKWSRVGLSTNPSRNSAARTGNRLYVTPNHHVYREGEYVPVADLSVGDTLTSYEYTFENIDLFLGGLLGDGSVCHNGSMCNYQEGHGAPQSRYIEEQRNLFSEGLVTSSNTFGGYSNTEKFWIQTNTARVFSDLRDEWYLEGVKVVPSDLSFITDAVVAKWFMDDGSLAHTEVQNDRAIFHTNGFIESDVRRLADKLTDLYGVSCTVYYAKGWTIRVNYAGNSIDKLWSSIAPYVFPSMQYKLPVAYRGLFTGFPAPVLCEVSKESIVTSVEHDVQWYGTNYGKSATRAFDIETETHNYMCQGVLVHNSLGILYFDGDKWAISTKGSFASDMAIHANKVWQEKYSHLSPNPDYTFLFEIVYKEGRIVVDYGDTDDLYLLGAVEKASGLPLSVAAAHGVWSPGTEELWTGPQVERFNYFTSVQEVLDAPERENAEGYVCIDTYTGAMVKVKHKTYLEKHRLYTNLTPRKVWEMLNDGMTYEEVLGEFPDEFEAQVREYLDKIKTDYDELCFQIGVTYEAIKNIEEQKDFAAEALKFHYQGELFMLRQGRSIHESVMKKIYPDAVDKK